MSRSARKLAELDGMFLDEDVNADTLDGRTKSLLWTNSQKDLMLLAPLSVPQPVCGSQAPRLATGLTRPQNAPRLIAKTMASLKHLATRERKENRMLDSVRKERVIKTARDDPVPVETEDQYHARQMMLDAKQAIPVKNWKFLVLSLRSGMEAVYWTELARGLQNRFQHIPISNATEESKTTKKVYFMPVTKGLLTVTGPELSLIHI